MLDGYPHGGGCLSVKPLRLNFYASNQSGGAKDFFVEQEFREDGSFASSGSPVFDNTTTTALVVHSTPGLRLFLRSATTTTIRATSLGGRIHRRRFAVSIHLVVPETARAKKIASSQRSA